MSDIKYIKGYRGVSEFFGMVLTKARSVLSYEVGCYMPTPLVFYAPQWFDDFEEISEKEFIKLLHDHLELILFEDVLTEIAKCGRKQNEI